MGDGLGHQVDLGMVHDALFPNRITRANLTGGHAAPTMTTHFML